MNEQCRKCRKYGEKLFLKGERCLLPKCSITRRLSGNTSSGSYAGKRKKSEYGTQLFEKQKAKSEYGMRERQFANIYQKASKVKGATGEIMLQMLERRLDNVVYRVSWSPSRKSARQMVSHRHIKVNGKILNIPSYIVNIGDIIEPLNIKLLSKEATQKSHAPKWLKTSQNKAEVIKLPMRDEIDATIDEQLIVEFYSR